MTPVLLSEKQRAVEALLQPFGRVLVAFSGGVDSTLVAALARATLGRSNVLAVTADSSSLAREDLAAAADVAVALDMPHEVVATEEVGRPDYQANTPGRCYVCKQTLFEALERLAAQRAFPVVCYGALASDQISERPGHRAALEFGVRAPLQEAGLAKWEVRELARGLGLPNWNRPQNACLASRIPHGQRVTVEKLQQVEAAEAFLRAEGFRQVRVRHLGSHARIEVGAEEVHRFLDPALCLALDEALRRLGFSSAGIDRGGYREGGADAGMVDEVLLHAIGRC